MIYLGTAAFVLMLLGDFNDAFRKTAVMKLCFPLGLVLLAAATVTRSSATNIDAVWCLVAAVFLLLLLYALFGSFPVNEAYATQESGRKVYDGGFYAMCRHPGVLFFAGLYFSLHFAVSLPLIDAVMYSGLNVLLAFAEDRWIFPRVLAGYDEYKLKTPFLIPTLRSVKEIFKK